MSSFQVWAVSVPNPEIVHFSTLNAYANARFQFHNSFPKIDFMLIHTRIYYLKQCYGAFTSFFRWSEGKNDLQVVAFFLLLLINNKCIVYAVSICNVGTTDLNKFRAYVNCLCACECNTLLDAIYTLFDPIKFSLFFNVDSIGCDFYYSFRWMCEFLHQTVVLSGKD